MRKYNIGDYIRIKTIDELLETYQDMKLIRKVILSRGTFNSTTSVSFIPSMYQLCGKSVRVHSVYKIGEDVRVNECGRYYRISPEWISQAKEMDFNIDKEKVLLLI